MNHVIISLCSIMMLVLLFSTESEADTSIAPYSKAVCEQQEPQNTRMELFHCTVADVENGGYTPNPNLVGRADVTRKACDAVQMCLLEKRKHSQ